MLTHDEHQLVDHITLMWARNHSKATVSVLSLMLMHERPRWAGELRDELCAMSGSTFDLDMQALHRMLRRLCTLGLIRCTVRESSGPGAARKFFATTETGVAVLKAHFEVTLGYLRTPAFTEAERRLRSSATPPCHCQGPVPRTARVRMPTDGMHSSGRCS